MALRRRNGRWHYRFKLDGREYSGTTDLADTARNETQARQLETDHRQALLEGRTPLRRFVDSGIMKWPTSAVCFGPPLGQSELLVWTERELGTGAGVGLENQGGALRADSPGV